MRHPFGVSHRAGCGINPPLGLLFPIRKEKNMVCIYCGKNTKVTNSRPQLRSNTIWRRRHCSACRAVFTTVEQSDLEKSLAVQSPDGLAPFLRDKLFISVYESLKHKKTALSDATALTDTITSRLLKHVNNGTIQKTAITSVAVEVLSRFDKTAATYFTAYHPVT